MPALAHIIEDKSKKGWSEKEFPDMILVIATSILQNAGKASTWLVEGRLMIDEMNAQLSPILEQTKYSAAYIYIMMPESVYQWKRGTGWEKLIRGGLAAPCSYLEEACLPGVVLLRRFKLNLLSNRLNLPPVQFSMMDQIPKEKPLEDWN
jgi:hypothetical protein